MKKVFKIIFTPLVFVFGILCGAGILLMTPFEYVVDFWNDQL